MGKDEILNKIKDLKSEIISLEKMVKKQEESKFERKSCGDEYYAIKVDSTGTNVCEWNEDSKNLDKSHFNTNNYFHTSERAREVVDKIKYLLKLERLHDTYCPDYKPDWDNEDEAKLSIYFDHYDNKYYYSFDYDMEDMPRVYFPTREIAQKVCNILNEELANKR